MDNKFWLALVWVVGAAVVATLAYSVWDLLKGVAARMAPGWRLFAPYLGAGNAIPVSAGRLIRIKSR